MAPPWDVCHQALVPLEPSPIPSVTVRASRGLLAAAHHVLQGIGKGTEGAWAAVAPGDSGGSAHWSSGLCCGQGRPPSPAPRSPGSADIPPPSHRSPAPRSGTACDVSACPLPPGQCLGGGWEGTVSVVGDGERANPFCRGSGSAQPQAVTPGNVVGRCHGRGDNPYPASLPTAPLRSRLERGREACSPLGAGGCAGGGGQPSPGALGMAGATRRRHRQPRSAPAFIPSAIGTRVPPTAPSPESPPERPSGPAGAGQHAEPAAPHPASGGRKRGPRRGAGMEAAA